MGYTSRQYPDDAILLKYKKWPTARYLHFISIYLQCKKFSTTYHVPAKPVSALIEKYSKSIPAAVPIHHLIKPKSPKRDLSRATRCARHCLFLSFSCIYPIYTCAHCIICTASYSAVFFEARRALSSIDVPGNLFLPDGRCTRERFSYMCSPAGFVGGRGDFFCLKFFFFVDAME